MGSIPWNLIAKTFGFQCRPEALHLETGSPYSQDKAIMAAIHDQEFTEPVNAEDWDAYIYDLAFCLERKLVIYAANQTDA